MSREVNIGIKNFQKLQETRNLLWKRPQTKTYYQEETY